MVSVVLLLGTTVEPKRKSFLKGRPYFDVVTVDAPFVHEKGGVLVRLASIDLNPPGGLPGDSRKVCSSAGSFPPRKDPTTDEH